MANMQSYLSNPELLDWHNIGDFMSFAGHGYFHRDAGAGPALLMVHGFPTSSWDWHKVLPILTRDFRVLAPDMLGFGFSDKPRRGDYTVAAHAAFHERLLRQLDVREVHILTYSSGSSIVQQMLANTLDEGHGQNSIKIKSVTFLNGGLFPGSNHPNRVQRLLLGPLGSLVARLNGRSSLDRNLRQIFGPDTQPDAQLVTDYWELLCLEKGNLRLPKLITYLNDRRNLAAEWKYALINHPAKKQLVVGMADSISGPDMAAEYLRTLPDPQVTELSNIGHYPQLETPQAVIDAVRQIAH